MIKDATNSNATSMTFLTGGNVGIGTTNPGFDLDIKKATDVFLNIENSIYNSGGGSASIYMSGGRADNNQNSSLEMQLNHTGNQSGWKMYWRGVDLSLIRISEPTRLLSISYAVFCLKKKKNKHTILHSNSTTI